MTMKELIKHKPYHHTDIELLDKVMTQVVEDVQAGDMTAVEVLLDYIPIEVLQSYLPEEE
jgi:hypothetical protein